ncbi:hypothetical protein HanPSC8_Chr11g0453371 [Helianthus annuus]|nr:hypothetical protein HanPSC8_Chr11g0453371 [Helianthus annuus]
MTHHMPSINSQSCFPFRTCPLKVGLPVWFENCTDIIGSTS